MYFYGMEMHVSEILNEMCYVPNLCVDLKDFERAYRVLEATVSDSPR